MSESWYLCQNKHLVCFCVSEQVRHSWIISQSWRRIRLQRLDQSKIKEALKRRRKKASKAQTWALGRTPPPNRWTAAARVENMTTRPNMAHISTLLRYVSVVSVTMFLKRETKPVQTIPFFHSCALIRHRFYFFCSIYITDLFMVTQCPSVCRHQTCLMSLNRQTNLRPSHKSNETHVIFTFSDAKELSHSGWRVPTLDKTGAVCWAQAVTEG